MPVVQNLYNNRISMKLNAGNNPATGKMIVKSAGLNKLSEAADAEKIMAIVDLAAPTLKHPLVQVERTAVFVLVKQ